MYRQIRSRKQIFSRKCYAEHIDIFTHIYACTYCHYHDVLYVEISFREKKNAFTRTLLFLFPNFVMFACMRTRPSSMHAQRTVAIIRDMRYKKPTLTSHACKHVRAYAESFLIMHVNKRMCTSLHVSKKPCISNRIYATVDMCI